MIIHVGSMREVKVRGVQEALKHYGQFMDAVVLGAEVESGVADQPRSINESIQGARNRARGCFRSCDYSFGIESGVFPADVDRGWMALAACVFHDGKHDYVGLSSAFELPRRVAQRIEAGSELNEAFYETDLVTDKRVINDKGAFGVLSEGRFSFEELIGEAVNASLVKYHGKRFFSIL